MRSLVSLGWEMFKIQAKRAAVNIAAAAAAGVVPLAVISKKIILD